MPTCRRKRVVLTEPSETLLRALKSDPDREVYYLEQTGEIFETYEAYAARMSFYRLKQFQCEVTGKSGLDYFQAVESEQQEGRTMHSRFPEPLKPAILKAVQWQVMGRLDHLVEAVYERFKDRYFRDEKVLVDINGIKYHAIVHKITPPKSNANGIKPSSEASSSTARISIRSENSDEDQPHKIGGDLKVSAKDALAHDDPARYTYWVRVLELEKERSHEKGKATAKALMQSGELLTGSYAEAHCNAMSRDRLSFSKSILRRFIRDCVDREAAVASPWTVKLAIAKRYGVDSVMPEETRKGVENIKKGEIDKRKKLWEDKEAPPTKKQKKMTAAQEERAKVLAAAAEKREREAREKAAKLQAAREEADRLAAEKKKKKAIRYPTEDLDIRITDRDKKAGMQVRRPEPDDLPLPFYEFGHDTFEQFLMTWNFLVVYGQPLHLSAFTLDEFEHAMRHNSTEAPCTLLAEIHSTLIYVLRTVPFQRHSAIRSIMHRLEIVNDVDFQQLSDALAEVGNNWERVPLRSAEGRAGWEDALVGCLKDHASLESFPTLQSVLTELLFDRELADGQHPWSISPGLHEPTSIAPRTISKPADRYVALRPDRRIATLAFMCSIAISSKAIRAHMESCEEQLTALRKEKIEVNRLKKQYTEEMNALLGEEEASATAGTNVVDEEPVLQYPSDLSDISPSEGDAETPSTTQRRTIRHGDKEQSRPQTKAQNQAHSKQRELARAKQASAKQAQAERRRLDEEVNKLERRLEGIEREFRKLFGVVRVKPLGKDRFYNRIWWFDGLGSASLLGSGGVVQYGAGRLFIQGTSTFDLDLLEAHRGRLQSEVGDDLSRRRDEEEGDYVLHCSEKWLVYSSAEQVEELIAWLNPKGVRELALKNALTKWWPHIACGMKKRVADLCVNAKWPEARRSARTKASAGPDITREPYMMWTNRKAVNHV